jgi:hypothetical protein
MWLVPQIRSRISNVWIGCSETLISLDRMIILLLFFDMTLWKGHDIAKQCIIFTKDIMASTEQEKLRKIEKVQ